MRISPTQSLKLLKSKRAGTLIGYLFLIMGAIAVIYAVKVRLDARNVKNWVPHLAQIEGAGLSTHVDDDGKATYSLIVQYLYEWDGTPYKGRRYRLHDAPSSDQVEMNKIVEALLLTKQDDGLYPIYVNPDKPVQSAIKNEVHPSAKSSSLFLGFFCSLIGFFMVFRQGRFSRKSRH